MPAPTFPTFVDDDGLPLVYDRRGEPLGPVAEHPVYDRFDDAILDALRRAGLRGRVRRGLARVLKDAGAACSPTGDDRQVVFALERLARKGYLIRPWVHPQPGAEWPTESYILHAEPRQPRTVKD